MVNNTVTVKARDTARYDGEAAGAITPGYLIERDGTSGTERTYVAHATAAAKTSVDIAIEGKGGKGIDDDYASGDYMEHKEFLRGDEFYGFVFDGANAGGTAPDTSANANLAVGDLVVSYGDGTFRKFVSGTDSEGAAIAEATEAVDNSGGSSPARVILKVI